MGLAYAVDGQVRNVRWFQTASAFALFRGTLLESAALDALTAQAGSGKRSAPKVEAAAVDRFMQDVESARGADPRHRRAEPQRVPGRQGRLRLEDPPQVAAGQRCANQQ